MNRKGFVQGALLYALMAFMFSFVAIFIMIIVDEYNGGIQAMNSTVVTNTSKELSQDYNDGIKNLDTGLGYLLVGFVIMSVIIARMVNEIKPIWLFGGIIGLMVIGFIGMILENIWGAFNANANISAITSQLVFIPFLMNNFIIVLIGYVGLVLIARFTRDQGGFGL